MLHQHPTSGSNSVFNRAYIAVIEHHNQKHIGEEGDYLSK